MQKIFFLLLSSLFLFACCKSDDNMPTPDPNIPEVEKLPPATQTGANTVGCLVNGMAFLPSGSSIGSSNPYCGYYYNSFSLVFHIVKNEGSITGNGSKSVAVYSSNLILEEEIYSLKNYNSNHSANFSISDFPEVINYNTNDTHIGELHITKLDKDNNIISGTFWFDAVNEQGEVIEIREGRFDMVFDGWAG